MIRPRQPVSVVRDQPTAVGPSVGRALSWKSRTFPLSFFTMYIVATVAVFEFGPWPWEVPSRPFLYGFLMIAWISLGAGFLSGAQRKPSRYVGRWKTSGLLKASLGLNLVLLGPTVYYQSGGAPDLIEALARPGEVYNRTQQRAAEVLPGQGTLLGYAVVYGEALTGPISYLLLPLAIVSRRQLPKKLVVACLSVAMAKLLVPLVLGVNKGLFDFVLVLPWCLWLAQAPGGRRIAMRKALVLATVFILLFGVVAVHLARNVSTRAGKETLDDYYGSLKGVNAEDHAVLRLLPDSWRVVLIANASYGVHGYYGLALCLEEEFEWTYGVGHSLILMSYAERLSGFRIFDRTYAARTEASTGYSSRVYWHTMFPWFASDLSFPGVIVLLFAIGRIFSNCWIESLDGENPFAVAMFCQLVTMMFYLPANNQLFQTLTSLITFWGLGILWVATRRTGGRAHGPTRAYASAAANRRG